MFSICSLFYGIKKAFNGLQEACTVVKVINKGTFTDKRFSLFGKYNTLVNLIVPWQNPSLEFVDRSGQIETAQLQKQAQ